MTRLYYWLHAQTQYSIHSPFLFDMYREVLFARLTPEERRRHGIPRHDRYRELIYKCCNHYHMEVASPQPGAHGGTLLLTHLNINTLTHSNTLSILLLSRPHATPAAEQQWEKLKADPDYQVSIDLYDVALLIRNPHLHRQHFLLR